MALIDSCGRKIDYLRISVTDRCNLRCRYCAPPFSGGNRMPHVEILTYEEIIRVAEAAVAAGITKIRVTGGEPLVRAGVIELFRMLGQMEGISDLSLTTNGLNLERLAPALKQAGVGRVNVSLDTLDRDRFRRITGRDQLDGVLAGIRMATSVGMEPVKLNVVVMRGFNDDEIGTLAGITFDHPYHVRFIELMPLVGARDFDAGPFFMSMREVAKRIPGIDRATIEAPENPAGPAKLCRLPGAKGLIGFITPMSRHFCRSCNRLRLTADGKVRACLLDDVEVDVKTPLRQGAARQELIALLAGSAAGKKRRHQLSESQGRKTRARPMHAIGG